MKTSRKNKKKAMIIKIFSDISRIFVLSTGISTGISTILIVLNAFNGIFIGFRYYIMLTIAMILTLAPCWVLCDSKRIFGYKGQIRKNKTKVVKNTHRKTKDTIRRRKIS